MTIMDVRWLSPSCRGGSGVSRGRISKTFTPKVLVHLGVEEGVDMNLGVGQLN